MSPRSHRFLSGLALVCVLVAATGDGEPLGPAGDRVFFGEVAKPGEFPFVAALEILSNEVEGWKFRCGGSVLDAYHILTAAHCVTYKGTKIVREPEEIRVKLGCHDRRNCKKTYEVVAVMAHHEYDFIYHLTNDVAILRVAQRIEFYPTTGLGAVGKIVPAKGILADENWGNVTLAGWGLTESRESSNVLIKVNIRTVSHRKCEQKFPGISDKEMCAGGSHGDACRGDSGGALFKAREDGTFVQVGIVSFGKHSCATPAGSVYARVASFESWITECTQNNYCKTL